MRFEALIPALIVVFCAGLAFGLSDFDARAPFDWLGGFLEDPAPGGVPFTK